MRKNICTGLAPSMRAASIMSAGMFINDKKTKFPKFWRTLFMVTIAVPQFVTLLLVRNFFSNNRCV